MTPMLSVSPKTKKSLEVFATHMHWGALGHPDDTERFWDFVISAYRNGDEHISLDEFLNVIDGSTKKGEVPRDVKFMKKRVNFLVLLFGKYEEGIRILRKFDAE